MLDKTYTPQDVEERIYDQWESSNAFACGQKPGADAYTIVIPPPNVTGSLHMGHALNNTLQDIMIRYKRMQGDRKSTRLNSSHITSSYAVFCLKKKTELQSHN